MFRQLSAASQGFRALMIAACAVTVVGCNNGGSSSSVTGPSPTLVTDTFSGSITQGTTGVHSFSVNSSGNSLLAGFTSITPLSVSALGLGIGSWNATSSTCSLNQTQSDTAHSGSTALSGSAGAGSYCVRVYDGGNIPEGVTVSYTVQVQHY